MIFKVEVEIDWIDEEYGIEETVKKEVFSSLTKEIKEKALTRAQYEIEKKVEDMIGDVVDHGIDSLVNEFFTTERKVTDSWGYVKKTETTEQIIKNKVANYFEQRVDKYGKETSSTYESSTRQEYLLREQVKKIADEQFKQIVKQSHDNAMTIIKESFKEHLSEKLISELGIEKMINGGK